MANEKFTVVGTNIQEKATMIWNVADLLRGPFKPHEYGLVILPMTVVKRFHDCLLPTHQAVLDTYEKVKKLAVTDGFLRRASGYQFYNTSKYTFDRLLADPENIESNFRDYLNGFSANVQDVLAKFDFENIIKRMVDSNTLYLVIKEFGSQKGYLGPDKISAVDCGYIFEDLVRRFSESFGEEAGAHFTSRDIIYLMTDMIEDAEEIMAAVKESAGLVMEPENRAALDRIEQEIIDLQNAVLELHKAKQQRSVTAADYAAQIKEYSQRMQELEAQQAELQTTENRYAEVKLWLDSFAEHIQSGAIMNADDSMIMKQLVEQIIVGEDGIEVHFKCGIVASHEYL